MVVYGNSGSGKSTLAAALAARLGVPLVELDAIAFDSRGVHVPLPVLRDRFRRAVAGDGWVVEGVHRDEIARALALADTFVWLDVNRSVVGWNLFRRDLGLLFGRRERHGRRLSLRSFVGEELAFIGKSLQKHPVRRVHGERFAELALARGVEVRRLHSRRELREVVAGATAVG